jgi:hypothetical protein
MPIARIDKAAGTHLRLKPKPQSLTLSDRFLSRPLRPDSSHAPPPQSWLFYVGLRCTDDGQKLFYFVLQFILEWAESDIGEGSIIFPVAAAIPV